MNRRKTIMIIFGTMLTVGFLFGIVRLFQLRFERGDIYPPYSSLRADPLGTKVLHDAMNRIPHLLIQRHLRDLSKIEDPKATTVLWLGESNDGLWGDEVLKFIREGGRLVLTLEPVVSKSSWNSNPAPPPTGNNPPFISDYDREIDKILSSNLGVGLEFEVLPTFGPAVGFVSAERAADLPLPNSLTWHSGVIFNNLDDAWDVIYERDHLPVLIERKFGLGSIVVSSDSFFVSNEALMNERHPELLVWMISESRAVFFDETHLGVESTPGISMLAREYRLHGIFFAFLVLAGLFIWKSSASFLPRRATIHETDFVEGRDSKEGFVNLLKRHVSANELLRICFDEWTKSPPGGAPITDQQLQAAIHTYEEYESTLQKKRNPTESYRQIALSLTRKD